MSFWYMALIMLITGVIGGIVNFLLPANNPEKGKYLKPIINCIVLGVGATLLVPLFLELAQSKLMDKIRFDSSFKPTSDLTLSNKTDTIKIVMLKDSANKIVKADTTKLNNKTFKTQNSETEDIGKNYLLWAAYCLLAAAAGFKFINMLISNVINEEKYNKVVNQKEELEKNKEKREKNAQLSNPKAENKALVELVKTNIEEEVMASGEKSLTRSFTMPVLPAITNFDDPQKGRFGGLAERNYRKLSAKVTNSNIPEYYSVELIVESTNAAKPLTDVLFFIHDSFTPNVYTVYANEFKNGKAIDDEILSYGAFTVGVITDNGNTFLELDLAENKDFPAEFRKR
jgi:hypothetical protein